MYILAFVRPSHEPSDHIIRTLFAQSGPLVILFFNSEVEMSRFNVELFPQIPQVSVATE